MDEIWKCAKQNKWEVIVLTETKHIKKNEPMEFSATKATLVWEDNQKIM